MAIKSHGFKDMQKSVNKLSKNIDSPKLLNEVANNARAIIVINTQQKGVDYKGKTFKPYSPAYKKRRQKKGRSGRVNLTFTNQMMSSIIHRLIGKGKILMTFSRAREAKKAGWQEDKGRDFFGLSSKSMETIKKKTIMPYYQRSI